MIHSATWTCNPSATLDFSVQQRQVIPLAGISRAARIASHRVGDKYRENGHGPWTAPEERAAAVRSMRAEGATMAECADVFGCSDQLIRQILQDRFPMYVTAEEAKLIREHRCQKARREAGGPP